MEKQTKILLGVGAVIAAYLIFKPKKAMAQTDSNKTPSTILDNNRITGNCIDGFIYNSSLGCVPSSKEDLSKLLEELKKQQLQIDQRQHQLPKDIIQNCNCFRAPCNCGDGGVKLDALIANQTS